MTTVYLFEIADDFDLNKIPHTYLLSEERLKKPELMPRIKHLTSLMGEIIVKTVIREKLGLQNSEIIIERTASGKPYLKNYPDFHFNISHSANAVAVAFSDAPVGIDIEKLGRPNFKVAERFFNYEEKEFIKNSPHPDYAFFEIWTAKEAYFKRLGEGISIEFSKISVFEENIKKYIHTFEKEEFLISLCCEDLGNCEFNKISETFFQNKTFVIADNINSC